MKLCVVGNSHVGMMLGAWRSGRDALPEALDLTFFARPGQGVEPSALEGSVLSAATPAMAERLEALGMPTRVDLSAFDGVVFVGNSASAFQGISMLQDHRVLGWRSSRSLVQTLREPLAPPAKFQLLTPEAYLAALVGAIRAGRTYGLVSHLREVSSIPAYVVPQPHPALAISEKRGLFRRFRRSGDTPAVAGALATAHQAAFADIPDLTIVPQPADTVTDALFTADEFTRGAVRLDGDRKQARRDVLHANRHLGERILSAIAELQQNSEISA